MLGKNLITAAAGNAGGEVLGIEDVFSTWLYTGNSSTQTITNGIDLSGEGGLVWIKSRSNATLNGLFDTARGANKALVTNSLAAQDDLTSLGITAFTSFNSSGFTLGDDVSYSSVNTSSRTYASWTFRKAEKFFDVVTYTGTGSARTVAHNLGSVPGCIIVKRLDTTSDWVVYHRSLGNTAYIRLNLTNAFTTSGSAWNSTDPTDSAFSVEGSSFNNASGGTYVAYLFAHDAGGFGDGGTESVIKCGTFTCDGSGNVGTVSLGWEPQWILAKRTDTTQNWYIWDTMRGWDLTNQPWLAPNLSNAEGNPAASYFAPTATGFSGTGNWFGANAQVAYIAIRRGPMKTPEDATTVFSALTATVSTGTVRTTGFPIDLQLVSNRPQNAQPGHFAYDRLRGVSTTDTAGGTYLNTTSTAVENTNITMTRAFTNTGFTDSAYLTGYSAVWWNFRRAPGFFDVVAYTGTGSTFAVSHNLGVAPELIITKNRSSGSTNWAAYAAPLGNTQGIFPNSNIAALTLSWWNNTSPTSTNFTVTGADITVNQSGSGHIAYLFATCPGVSKVGSYTGTGTTLSIDCGFTAGARFVLIKRTDSTGDWYVWDSARGIVSGNDPYLLLNSTAAENTSTDYIDPLSSGFQISSTAPAAINASGGSFIFLAIA